jgi:hypothetical protein
VSEHGVAVTEQRNELCHSTGVRDFMLRVRTYLRYVIRHLNNLWAYKYERTAVMCLDLASDMLQNISEKRTSSAIFAKR